MTLRPDEKNEGWVVAQWELACYLKITMCDQCPQLGQAQHRLAVSAVENMNRRTSPPRNIFLRLFIKQRSSWVIPAKLFSRCFFITISIALVASELLQKVGHGLFMSTMWFFNLSWSSFGCLRAVVTHDKRCWACANCGQSIGIVLKLMVGQTLVGIAQCFLTGGGSSWYFFFFSQSAPR